jgi:hypothetical protein
VVEVSKKEVVPKVRKIGDYLRMMQNCYVIVLFNLTAEDTVNRRVLMALKELRELAKTLLDDVDELIRELEGAEKTSTPINTATHSPDP